MKNKFFTLLLLLLFGMFLHAETYNGTCGENLTWVLNTEDSTLTITGTGFMTDWLYSDDVPWSSYRREIKSVTIGEGITTIGQNAFENCHSLTTVTIPNCIENIGPQAFFNCYYLANVSLSNSLTSIGYDAFNGCRGMTSITIPQNVIHIEEGAFNSCFGLVTITVATNNTTYDSRNNCNAIIETATNTLIVGCQNTSIPNGVTKIGSKAFFGCIRLSSLSFPNSVTSIENSAFYACKRLSSVTIPGSITSIGDAAFGECDNMTSIFISNSVTSIGRGVVSRCGRLSSIVVDSDNTYYDSRNNCNAIIETASNKLIAGCKYTSIPNDVCCIGDEAFMGSSCPIAIELPSSITEICSSAFWNSNLTSIVIPYNIIRIGDRAFGSCYNLTTIEFLNSTPPMFVGTGSFSPLGNCSFLVPCGTKDAYFSSLNNDIYGSYPSNLMIKTEQIIEKTAFSYEIRSNNTHMGSAYILQEATCADPTIVIRAEPKEGNSFFQWSDGNTDVERTIVLTQDTSLLAEFVGPCLLASGICGAQGNNLTWELSCDSVLTISGIGDMPDFNRETAPWFSQRESIVSVIVNSGVTNIGGNAFCNCNMLSSISIPNTVTIIEDSAFFYCYALTSITIPNSVSFVGNSAFFVCKSLTSISFPNSVTSIGVDAFRGCNSLTSIFIPNSVTNIGTGAFSCENLSTIIVESGNPTYDSRNNCNAIIQTASNSLISGCIGTIIPNGIVRIDNRAFDISNLTSITIPNSVVSIEYGAFFACDSLHSIIIPNSVTSIGHYAFWYCSNLDSVTIPNSVSFIGSAAFHGCSSLKTIFVPNSVTSIGERAFASCDSLASIVIPNSVTSLEDQTFWRCSKLKSISVPSSITTIGYEVFYACDNLTEIEFFNPTPPTIGVRSFEETNCMFIVPCGSKDAYVAALNVNNTIDASRVIEKPVFSYEISSLDDTMGLVSIVQEPTCEDPTMIIRAVANEGYLFFQWSDGNTDAERTIVLTQDTSLIAEFVEKCIIASGTCGAQGDNLTWELSCDSVLTISGIGEMADLWGEDAPWYSYRPIINRITIEGEVTSIGVSAFSGCSGIKELIIPSSVTSIGTSAFSYCSGLTSVIIPCGIIDSYAFSGCNNLTSVTIGSAVTSIGDFAFESCRSLTSFTIPNGVTSIGLNPFTNCEGLTTLLVQSENTNYDCRDNSNAIVKTATNEIISGCQNTVIPNSVTSINDFAFYGSRNLININIPNSVISIGEHSFAYCYSLTSLFIPSSITNIGNSAFFDCSNLTSIIVQSGNPSYDSRNNCNAIIETVTNKLIRGCKNTIIPNDVTSIGLWAFSNCWDLTSITIPESVTSIETAAFFGCRGITSITIPDNVTRIERQTFAYCSLTSIIIGNGITCIEEYSFDGCSNLSSISFPQSVDSIWFEAFRGCYSLTSIFCFAENPPVLYYNSDIFTDNPFHDVYTNATVSVPAYSMEAYMASEWSLFTLLKPMFVISDAGYASYYNGSQAYTMPEGVEGYVFNTANGLVKAYESGDVVPANTALVLKADEGYYPFSFTTGGTAPTTTNQLLGTDAETTLDEDAEAYFYALSLDENGENVGFYWMNETGSAFTNSAHRAYLKLPKSQFPSDAAPRFFVFNEDNSATTINNIENNTDATKYIHNGNMYIRRDGKTYDTTGRIVKQ